MNFDLPPIADSVPEIPELSESMLASMPSTALASMANSQASLMTGINTKAAGVRKRAEKLSGNATANLPTMGRVPFESTASAEKVTSSVAAAVGPIVGTASLMKASADMPGEDILENATAAGTSETDAAALAGALDGFIQTTLADADSPVPSLELASLQAGLAKFASSAGIIQDNLKTSCIRGGYIYIIRGRTIL